MTVWVWTLPAARFTASIATSEARDTIDAGLTANRFYLQTGGDTRATTPLDGQATRQQADARPPEVSAE